MDKQLIGVGPHPKPWPKDDRYDQELLENGDSRNVVDKYRYWKTEAIKADLDKTRLSLHVAIENLARDFNAGTIVRNANAFNVGAVHVIGRRNFNRRGAMVTDRYLEIVHHETADDFVKTMKSEGYEVIAMDIVPGAKSLHEVRLPEKCVLVFGSESDGISEELLEKADQVVAIEQLGSTRSVNVGVASGIAMYAWMQQNTLGH